MEGDSSSSSDNKSASSSSKNPEPIVEELRARFLRIDVDFRNIRFNFERNFPDIVHALLLMRSVANLLDAIQIPVPDVEIQQLIDDEAANALQEDAGGIDSALLMMENLFPEIQTDHDVLRATFQSRDPVPLTVRAQLDEVQHNIYLIPDQLTYLLHRNC